MKSSLARSTSFVSSYRTYGARRVWHDLLAEDLLCGLHRIERLMRLHGLKARPRRRELPKDVGERSVIADNVLDRPLTAEAPPEVGGGLHLHLELRMMAVRRRRHRPVLTPRGRLVDERHDDRPARDRSADDGDPASRETHTLLHRSDEGNQYTSEQFQRRMADNGVTCSMS